MKTISVKKIEALTIDLIGKAALVLRRDVEAALVASLRREGSVRAKNTLRIILENARLARTKSVPICQDTGMTVIFCEVGQSVRLVGGDLGAAMQSAVEKASKKFYLRASVVKSPIRRTNTGTNAPGLVHFRIVPGSKVTVKVLLKGFGCENKSQVMMFNPTAPVEDIIAFIGNAVVKAGANACPPFVVGVGMGGTLDKACELSKEVLFTDIRKKNVVSHLSRIERAVEHTVNMSKIGSLGFGGKTTTLRVMIAEYPTHIAGLPVVVNINCHALRTAIGSV